MIHLLVHTPRADFIITEQALLTPWAGEFFAVGRCPVHRRTLSSEHPLPLLPTASSSTSSQL